MSKSISMECVSSGLDIFKHKPVQTSVESGYYVECRPVASLTDNSPIEFVIKGSPEHYLDLSDTHLHVQAQIVREDGSQLQPEDDGLVTFEQLAIHTLFSECDLMINNCLVTTSSNTYAYRAYIETLLNYDKATKKSQLELSMFYPHSTGDFEFTKDNKSKTLEKRRKKVNRSKICDLIGKTHVDLSFNEQYILNGVDVRFRFVRSKDNFVLNACPGNGQEQVHPYKVKIIHAGLFVRKLKINPSIMLAHASVLEKTTSKYHVKRVLTKTHSAARGTLNVNIDSLFSNQIPSRILVAMCDSDAFNGNYSKSAFQFKHNYISSLNFHVDGVAVPSKSFAPDFERGIYARSYFSLFQGTNKQFDINSHGITYDDYQDGFAMWCVNLSPTPTDDDCIELYKHGALSLSITLSKPLDTPVNIILYSVFDGCINIDKARNVLLDW